MATPARLAFALSAATGALGCAPGPFRVHTSFAGIVDTDRDRATSEQAQAMPWEGDHGVTVYQDGLPEGLSVKDGTLSIAPQYDARYRLVGTVWSAHSDSALPILQSIFLYPPFHASVSRERDIYCKVQTPFRILTLGLWILVPFDWACSIHYSRDRDENLELHLGEIRRAAAVMGGNIAVIKSISRRTENTGGGSYGGVIWVSTTVTEAAYVEAFVLAEDKDAAIIPIKPKKPAFSRGKAAASLARAAESVEECRADGGPTGAGHAKITFDVTGEVIDVELDPPYLGTAVGECIAKKFRRANVPDFDGDPVVVGKSFVLRNGDD